MSEWRCPACGVQLFCVRCPYDGAKGRPVRERRQSELLAMCKRKAARDAARPPRERKGPLWFFGVSW